MPLLTETVNQGTIQKINFNEFLMVPNIPDTLYKIML